MCAKEDDTACFDCGNYFASDIYRDEYYCEARKKWFSGDFEIITQHAKTKCDKFEDDSQ